MISLDQSQASIQVKSEYYLPCCLLPPPDLLLCELLDLLLLVLPPVPAARLLLKEFGIRGIITRLNILGSDGPYEVK